MRHRLTELQLALLDVLWREQEASVAAVHDALRRERPIVQSTVATLLSRLEEKGLVARRQDGRQYLYRAAVTREEVRGSVLQDFAGLASRLFAGDTKGLVSALLEAADVDADDIARARRLLAERERELRRGED